MLWTQSRHLGPSRFSYEGILPMVIRLIGEVELARMQREPPLPYTAPAMVGRWSIRASLGSLAAIVTLPLLLLVGALFVSQLRAEQDEARDEALRLARTTATRLHSLHAESLALLERMAARPAIRNFDGATCDSLFAIVEFYPQYANLYFFDGSGRVLCSGRPAPE